MASISQSVIVHGAVGDSHITLRSRPASHALGHAVLGHHMVDAGTATGGAQKFC